jgi:hypothetical protein
MDDRGNIYEKNEQLCKNVETGETFTSKDFGKALKEIAREELATVMAMSMEERVEWYNNKQKGMNNENTSNGAMPNDGRTSDDTNNSGSGLEEEPKP